MLKKMPSYFVEIHNSLWFILLYEVIEAIKLRLDFAIFVSATEFDYMLKSILHTYQQAPEKKSIFKIIFELIIKSIYIWKTNQ